MRKIPQLPGDGHSSKYQPPGGGKVTRVHNRESQLAKGTMLWQVSGAIRCCQQSRKGKTAVFASRPPRTLWACSGALSRVMGARRRCSRSYAPGSQAGMRSLDQRQWEIIWVWDLNIPEPGRNQSAHMTADIILPWVRGRRMVRA